MSEKTEQIKQKTANKTVLLYTGKKTASNSIYEAARILRNGGLVAIPTETVYGLAANALDETAVKRIFIAKGRPQDNPLIVHIPETGWLSEYAEQIPDSAYRLAEAFWPGPMTMVLKKKACIPSVVAAGLDTVGIRLPSHPIAREIIREAGVPLAAPSANLSGKPSPTEALHVYNDLNGKIDAIVDGGPCGVGVESTVIALCQQTPRILRPGGITPEQIRSVIGDVIIDEAVTQKLKEGVKAASPGMKYKHYAPKAKVVIVDGNLEEFENYLKNNTNPHKNRAVLCFEGEEKEFDCPSIIYGRIGDAASQANGIFAALRKLDDMGAEFAFAREPEKHGVGLAVYNRLLRAAAFNEESAGHANGLIKQK